MAVTRQDAAGKLRTLVGLAQTQIAAQLGEADSNTTMAVGLLAVYGAAILAIVTVGETASGVGQRWGWPIIGFGVAVVLLLYVIWRKTYEAGPQPGAFYLAHQEDDEFEFNLTLIAEIQAAYDDNERLLTREQVIGIYPSLFLAIASGVAEVLLIHFG